MKQLFILALLFITGITITSFEQKYIPETDNSFVVVELFTSQGCSSCPAADKVLSDIIKENNDKPVYGLSFHVSYWNYLGWKDPYSNQAFTDRQKEYSQVMGRGQVYTPQMIVNGTQEFVGSSKAKAENRVAQLLAQSHENDLKVNLENRGNEITLHYALSGSTEGIIMHAALVERDITNKVLRGENSGRTLHHDNVVRVFETVPAKTQGQVLLSIPENVKINKSAVIVYAQDENTMEIVAAAKEVLTK